jgi:hypothetical protein
MKANHLLRIGLAAAVTFAWISVQPPAASSRSNFDEWDRRVITTFDEPIVAGSIVLPAGTYSLKVMSLGSNREVVGTPV